MDVVGFFCDFGFFAAGYASLLRHLIIISLLIVVTLTA
jgi:hypothetical protein